MGIAPWLGLLGLGAAVSRPRCLGWRWDSQIGVVAVAGVSIRWQDCASHVFICSSFRSHSLIHLFIYLLMNTDGASVVLNHWLALRK